MYYSFIVLSTILVNKFNIVSKLDGFRYCATLWVGVLGAVGKIPAF